MRINGTEIVDTFAEAFEMWAARVIITAESPHWARAAGLSMTGFATSVIRCKCEAAMEREIPAGETPDRRPGVSVLLFTVSEKDLEARLVDRIGQCVMTCPTTACFNGLDAEQRAGNGAGNRVTVGGRLRYFGDGYQISKMLNDRRYWRIPVMEGEFLIEECFGIQPAVGGGNLIIMGANMATALEAAENAAEAMRAVPGVILPFPQGVVRCGSKVGSKYQGLIASTNDAYCPSLRGFAPESKVPEGADSVYEIVIDGLDVPCVEEAMRRGMKAAAEAGAIQITAGNYGGVLGKYKIGLHGLLKADNKNES